MNLDLELSTGPSATGGLLSPATSPEGDTPRLDVEFATDPADRLFSLQPLRLAAAQRRFIAAFVFCLLVHAGAFYALLHEFGFVDPPAQGQEIPVEVVIEPPPQKEPAAPAPEQKKPEISNSLDLKPAIDAPRAANDEKIERTAPDDVSQAPRVEPSAGESAAAPADKAPSTAQEPVAQAKAEPAPPAPSTDKPDAEPVERAQTKPAIPSESTKSAAAKAQSDKEANSMAELLAGIKPLPDYKIGNVARTTPVAGGKAESTYLTILFGMIMPHMVVPPHLRDLRAEGVITFDLDGGGNLTYQTVARSSGYEDFDEAALAAVRQGGPFPMTPNGLPVTLRFTYTSK
jgi:TonB family protein